MKSFNLQLIATLAAIALAACAPNASYWNSHPNGFAPFASGWTKELVYRPEERSIQCKLQVVLGTDAALPLKFAKYEGSRWVGDGVILEVRPKHLTEVGIYRIDYTPLSGATIGPGQRLPAAKCPTIWIEVPRSAFVIREARPILTELEVTFALQTRDGVRLPVSKMAQLKPMFLLMGFEKPFEDKQPAL